MILSCHQSLTKIVQWIQQEWWHSVYNIKGSENREPEQLQRHSLSQDSSQYRCSTSQCNDQTLSEWTFARSRSNVPVLQALVSVLLSLLQLHFVLVASTGRLTPGPATAVPVAPATPLAGDAPCLSFLGSVLLDPSSPVKQKHQLLANETEQLWQFSINLYD